MKILNYLSKFMLLTFICSCVGDFKLNSIKLNKETDDGFKKFSGSVAVIMNQIIPSAYAYDSSICRSRKSVSATDYVEGYLFYTDGTEELICDADIVNGNYELDMDETKIPNTAVFKIKAMYQGGTRTQVLRTSDFSDETKFDLNPAVSVEASAMIGSIKKTGSIPNSRSDFTDAHLFFEHVLGTSIGSLTNTKLTIIQELVRDPETVEVLKESISKLANSQAVDVLLAAQVKEKINNATNQYLTSAIKIPENILNQISVSRIGSGDFNSAYNAPSYTGSPTNLPHVRYGVTNGRCLYLAGTFQTVKVDGKPATAHAFSPLYNAFMGYQVASDKINSSDVLRETIVSLSPYDDTEGLPNVFRDNFSEDNATKVNAIMFNADVNVSKNIAKFCVNTSGIIEFDAEFTNNLKGGIEGEITGLSLSNTSPRYLIINTDDSSSLPITTGRYGSWHRASSYFDDIFNRFIIENEIPASNFNSKSVVDGKLKIALDGSDVAI